MNTVNSKDATNLPLVSVAIITFNQKDFLIECIESILSQDYPNIEIIVADDCSTDGTKEVLNNYADKYNGKFILRLAENNQGITVNSNEAHFACTGKYIAWIGGDDLMLPGKVSRQVAFMESNPTCSICYHNLDVFDNKSGKTLHLYNDKYKAWEGGMEQIIRNGTFNGACATMVKRSDTPVYGFDNSLPVASDWLYWIETLRDGGKIKYINAVLGRYRRHSNNITKPSDKLEQNIIDHLNSCNLIIERYPQYFNAAVHRLGDIYVAMRKHGNYFDKLWVGLKLNFRFKIFIILIIYLVSLGKIKI